MDEVFIMKDWNRITHGGKGPACVAQRTIRPIQNDLVIVC
jgi:hypothetical protein